MTQVIEHTNDAGYIDANSIEPVLALPKVSIHCQCNIGHGFTVKIVSVL